METLKTYKQFYDETLGWWRENHPNSTPPRDGLISMWYDDYLKEIKAKKDESKEQNEN